MLTFAQVRHYIERMAYQDIVQTMGKAKGFLFPLQWDEPFGMVVIEAMAAGTPVLAYSRGSMPELIQNGETGYLVPPREVGAYADAIQRIVAEPALRDSLGAAGYAKAAGYNWDKANQAVLDAYLGLAS